MHRQVRTHAVGETVADKKTGEEMVVVSLPEERVESCICTYKHDMTPVTVADYHDADSEFISEGDSVYGCVFLDRLNERYPKWGEFDESRFEELVENKKLNPYLFPATRIQ